MFKVGDKVKIVKLRSAFCNQIGEIAARGNGSMWSVVFFTEGNNLCSYDIYFSEKELEVVQN